MSNSISKKGGPRERRDLLKTAHRNLVQGGARGSKEGAKPQHPGARLNDLRKQLELKGRGESDEAEQIEYCGNNRKEN